MKHARMLYKLGSKFKTDLGTFDNIVVDQCDEKKFNATLNDGFYMTQAEAVAKKHDKPTDPPPVEKEVVSTAQVQPPPKELSKAEKGLQKAKDKLK